MKLEVVPIVG